MKQAGEIVQSFNITSGTNFETYKSLISDRLGDGFSVELNTGLAPGSNAPGYGSVYVRKDSEKGSVTPEEKKILDDCFVDASGGDPAQAPRRGPPVHRWSL